MSLTRNYKKTVQERALKDKAFRKGLLFESIKALFRGDVATSKSLFCDYMKARTKPQ